MLQNAYFLAKIGADTAEDEQHFAEILPTDALWRLCRLHLSESDLNAELVTVDSREELQALQPRLRYLSAATWIPRLAVNRSFIETTHHFLRSNKFDSSRYPKVGLRIMASISRKDPDRRKELFPKEDTRRAAPEIDYEIDYCTDMSRIYLKIWEWVNHNTSIVLINS